MKKIVMGICALMLSVASYAQVGKTTISGHFKLAMSLLRMFVVSLSSTTTSTRIT